MRKLILVLLLVLSVTACRKSEVVTPATSTVRVTTRSSPTPVKGGANIIIPTDVPRFMETSVLGSKVGADGKVEGPMTIFNTSEPVSLTMQFHESPPGLQASVKWYAADQKAFEHEEQPMNGSKVVTFTLKSKLKPGHYHAEGYWGGNLAAEKKFEVVGKPEARGQKPKSQKRSP